jgi:hypothetical protein
MTGKDFLAYTSPDGPRVSHVRSTLVNSSLEALRRHGHYDRLVARLPRELHEPILQTITPSWLPIDVAFPYYQLLEQLGLSEAEQRALGDEVNNRINNSLLNTLLRAARLAGADPWIPLGQYDRFWSRIFQGGSIKIVQRGPKEAVIESRGLAMLGLPNWRREYGLLVRTASAIFAKTTYVRELPARDPETLILLVSWV